MFFSRARRHSARAEATLSLRRRSPDTLGHVWGQRIHPSCVGIRVSDAAAVVAAEALAAHGGSGGVDVAAAAGGVSSGPPPARTTAAPASLSETVSGHAAAADGSGGGGGSCVSRWWWWWRGRMLCVRVRRLDAGRARVRAAHPAGAATCTVPLLLYDSSKVVPMRRLQS